MIIKKLKIENFRCFHGTNEIDFVTDNQRNTTVIYASNSVGKTALLNTIVWCLFGDTTPGLNNPELLVNKRAKRKNSDTVCIVALDFDADGRSFRALRRGDAKSSKLQVFENNDGDYQAWQKGKDPALLINEIIPQDMSKYFFIDEENADQKKSDEEELHVQRGVEAILGHGLANSLIDDLVDVKKEHASQIKKKSAGTSLEKLKTEEISIIDKIERYDKQKKENTTAVESLTKQRDNLIKSQGKSPKSEIANHSKQRESQRNFKIENENLLDVALKDQVTLIQEYGFIVFGTTIKKFDEVYAMMDDQNIGLKKLVVQPERGDLARQLLSSKPPKCICGRPLESDSEEATNITQWGKDQEGEFQHDIFKRGSTVRALAGTFADRSEEIQSKFTKNLEEISRCRKNIENAKDEVKKFSELLKELSSKDNNKDLEPQIIALGGQISTAQSLSSKAEDRLGDLRPRKTALEGLINKQSGVDFVIKRHQICENTIQSVIDRIKEELELSTASMKTELVESMNYYVEKYMVKKRKVAMDDNYTLFFVDDYGEKDPLSGSDGAILHIIYISSLIELARKRKNDKNLIVTPGSLAPLIIDAPFSKCDDHNSSNLAKALPELVDQLIILEWPKKNLGTDTILRENNRLSKQYCLLGEVEGEMTDHNRKILYINDKQVDGMKYGCEFEKTVIEEIRVNE